MANGLGSSVRTGVASFLVAALAGACATSGAPDPEKFFQSKNSFWVTSLAFSPDGRRVLTGSGADDDTLKLFEAATGRLVRTFGGHSRTVRSVAFSPDGRRVL